MESGVRKLNPREEEKELDDKLMELGLLEPGMTLQEKRELASVVLESTRMAEEQMSQRVVEEEWETILLSPGKSTKVSNRAASRSPELITISSEMEEGRLEEESSNEWKRGHEKGAFKYRVPSSGNNESKMDKGERTRRSKRERVTGEITIESENPSEEMQVEGVDEGARERGKRIRREEEGKNGREAMRRKVEGERVGKDHLEAVKKKWAGTEEPEENKRARREREEGVEGKGNGSSTKSDPPVEVSKVVRTFYGPSSSGYVKDLNPLRSELHGYGRKRCPDKIQQVNLMQLAKEEVIQGKKSQELDEKQIEELVLGEENDPLSHGDDLRSKKSTSDKGKEERQANLAKHFSSRTVLQGKKMEEKLKHLEEDDKDDWLFNDSEESKLSKLKPSRMGVEASKMPELRDNNRSEPKEAPRITNSLSLRDRKERGVDDGKTRDENDVEGDRKGGGESDSSGSQGLSDFIVTKKKLAMKGGSSRKWVDVVITGDLQNKDSHEEVKKLPKNKRKEDALPNKRWRRVKRKFESSYGSGSEVDEWISSEEEQKTPSSPLTKEKIIARFDEHLNRLNEVYEESLSKEDPLRNKRRRCQLCEKTCKMKVPPGFQEPDSDDEWNLWKICFSNPPTSNAKEKCSEKDEPKRDKAKANTIPLTYRKAVTRSQMKQGDGSCSPHSVSKSPASQDDGSSASTHLEVILENDKPSNLASPTNEDVHSTSISPVMDEVNSFVKNVSSSPFIPKTRKANDAGSRSSTSKNAAEVCGTKDSERREPMWNLMDTDSDEDEGARSTEKVKPSTDNGIHSVKESNITFRRKANHSPEYVPNREERSPSSSSVKTHTNDVMERISPSLLDKHAVVEHSPVVYKRSKGYRSADGSRGPRVEKKLRESPPEVEENMEDDEEVQEITSSTTQNRRRNDHEEMVACPLCNKEFPMSEIEVHASECNQEDSDDSQEMTRGQQKEQGYREMGAAAGGPSGGCQRRFEAQDDDDEESEGDEFYETEATQSSVGPRPAKLSTFIPISQQKDSLIDYSDQFPHKSGTANMQATLERMRKSLLKRVRKKTGFRRRKRGKWRRKKL